MSPTNGREIEYGVVLSRDPENNWLVSVPAFPGCHTFGATRQEALANAREAIEACLESLTASGDGLPESDSPVEVEVVRVALPAA
jgi:antitoxin HicB